MNDPVNEYAYYVMKSVDDVHVEGYKIHIRDDAKYSYQQRRSIQAFYDWRQYRGWDGKCKIKNQAQNVRFYGCHSSMLADISARYPDQNYFFIGAFDIPKDYPFIEFESVWDFYKHIGYDHKRNAFILGAF